MPLSMNTNARPWINYVFLAYAQKTSLHFGVDAAWRRYQDYQSGQLWLLHGSNQLEYLRNIYGNLPNLRSIELIAVTDSIYFRRHKSTADPFSSSLTHHPLEQLKRLNAVLSCLHAYFTTWKSRKGHTKHISKNSSSQRTPFLLRAFET